MKCLTFYKMHDLGNDFIVLDHNEQDIDMSNFQKFVQDICDRKYGIGCDQLITIDKLERVHQANDMQKYRISIYNQDASRALACGNGMRCVAYLIYQKYADTLPHMLVDDRTIKAKILDAINAHHTQVEVNMGRVNLSPLWKPNDDELIQYATRHNLELRDIFFADVGNPHMIIFSNLSKDHMLSVGQSAQSLIKYGVNVSFAHIKNRQLFLKVWERGVGITNACGSGACASAAVAQHLKFIDDQTQVHFDSGMLTIAFDQNSHVVVRGGAHLVATGQFYYEI
ncbi:Diaminopimelate epimerase [Rickettsiales endosymbiont of Paramecium tredecaurelia]|uniref:diaminopimelate epimerase n=1 Tax=Candidatus Sarmatiella mevalonica TaxID=2770581 RepID=UPI001923A6A2|nr:diaminopimelate epimerase [Candidatus Sarmatiella mevalonica]MBL3284848.1 Diaminopimelate epimerase [Candidatus Sarmatiella mevalonica]